MNILNGLLGVLFVPFAVKRLGLVGYALLSVYGLVAGYVSLFDLGLGKNLQRLIAGSVDEEHRVEHFRIATGLYLLLFLLLVCLVPLLWRIAPEYLFPVSSSSHLVVRLVAVFAVAEFLLGFPSSILQANCLGRERFADYARYQMVAGLLRYGISFASASFTTRPELIVLAIVLRRIPEAALASRMLGPLPEGIWRPRWNLSEYRQLLRRSIVLSFAQILQLSALSAGSILVNRFDGMRALGVYRAVFDISSRIWFFSNTLGMVIFPRFVKKLASAEGRGQLSQQLPAFLQISWASYVALSALAAILGRTALEILGLPGTEYFCLFVLMISGVSMNAHTNVAYELLQASGLYGTVAKLSLLSLVGIVFSFLIVHRGYPSLAIGWAWLSSQAVYALASDFRTLKVLSVDMTKFDLLMRLCGVLSIFTVSLGFTAPTFHWSRFVGFTLSGVLVINSIRRLLLLQRTRTAA